MHDTQRIGDRLRQPHVHDSRSTSLELAQLALTSSTQTVPDASLWALSSLDLPGVVLHTRVEEKICQRYY